MTRFRIGPVGSWVQTHTLVMRISLIALAALVLVFGIAGLERCSSA
jgi:hypothetical protein